MDQPLGIPPSPILAPAYDLYGILRQNGSTVVGGGGQGQNVYIDRGAIQRADNTDPTAALTTPSAGGQSSVTVTGQTLSQFVIQLSDGTGVGVDPTTVTASQFTVTFNGAPLTIPNNYTFTYAPSTGLVTLSAATGVWANGTYVITLNNSAATGIRDLAGNPLQPNNGTTGTTTFTITLQASSSGGGSSPWQNTAHPDDVNNDGFINAQDALIIINALNEDLYPGGLLPIPAPSPPPYYYDVDGNGYINATDALIIINYLNANGATPDSAESAAATTNAVSTQTAAAFAADSGSSSDAGAASEADSAAPADGGAVVSAASASTPAIVAAAPAASAYVNTATVRQAAVVALAADVGPSAAATASNAVQQSALIAGGSAATVTAPSGGNTSGVDGARQLALSNLLSGESLWQHEDETFDGLIDDVAEAVQAGRSQA